MEHQLCAHDMNDLIDSLLQLFGLGTVFPTLQMRKLGSKR